MIIIHATGKHPIPLKQGNRVSIGFSDNDLVFDAGSTQAIITCTGSDSCDVEAFGMNVRIGETRVRNGKTGKMRVGDILKVGMHTIQIQERLVRDLEHMSLPGADPREVGPPSAQAEPTFSTEALEVPTPTLVPAPNRPEADTDPPTDRRDAPLPTVDVEVPYQDLAPPGTEGTFAMLELEMKRRIKSALEKLARRQRRQLEETRNAMLDTVGTATHAMRAELDERLSYRQFVATATIVAVAILLIVGYKETFDVRTTPSPVLESPSAETRSVVVWHLPESEQEPFVPPPSPPTRAIVARVEAELVEDTAEVEPPGTPTEPIAVDLDSIICERRFCDFQTTSSDGIVAYRAYKVRDGACETGGPCLVDKSGNPIPKTCLSEALPSCPKIEVLARY